MRKLRGDEQAIEDSTKQTEAVEDDPLETKKLHVYKDEKGQYVIDKLGRAYQCDDAVERLDNIRKKPPQYNS